eukprot:tig00021583_g22647.t1
MQDLTLQSVQARGAQLGSSPQQLEQFLEALRHVVTLAYRVLSTPKALEVLAPLPPSARLVGLLGKLGVGMPGTPCKGCGVDERTGRPRHLFPEIAYVQKCRTNDLVYATVEQKLDGDAFVHLCWPRGAGGKLGMDSVRADVQRVLGAQEALRGAGAAPVPAPAAAAPGATPVDPSAPRTFVVLKSAFHDRKSLDVLRTQLGMGRCGSGRLGDARRETAEACRARGINIEHCPEAPPPTVASPEQATGKRAAGGGEATPASGPDGTKRPRVGDAAAADGSSPERAAERRPQEAGDGGLPEIEPVWSTINGKDVTDLDAATATWSTPTFFKRSATEQRKFLERHFGGKVHLAEIPHLSFDGATSLIVLLARALGFPPIDPVTQMRSKNWREEVRPNDVLVAKLRQAIKEARQTLASVVKEEGEGGTSNDPRDPPETPGPTPADPTPAGPSKPVEDEDHASSARDSDVMEPAASELEGSLVKQIESASDPAVQRELHAKLEMLRAARGHGVWPAPPKLKTLRECSKPGGPACANDPHKRAELVATRRYGYRSYGPVRWRGQILHLPFGVVPEGMTGPPDRLAEHFGSELGLNPPPVDLLALRAIEGALLERPHGPPHASALAAWATSPERCVVLPCNLLGGGVDSRFIRKQRAEGKFAAYVAPLPPGCSKEDEARHDYVVDRGAQACISLSGALAAVHLPGLFREGAGIERVAAAVACASTAFRFSVRRSTMYNEARDQTLLDEARAAAEAALRTGRLDVMREKLAGRPGGKKKALLPPPRPAAARPPRRAAAAREAAPAEGKSGESKKKRGPRIATGFQRAQGASVPIPISLNPQFGTDTNANRRLHLANGYFAGVLEYLFPALCAFDVKAGCDMAEIALRLLDRQPYNYGFWSMQWMNSPETIATSHRDKNDAQEAYAALVYFHPDGTRDRRLHRLRFPALGISLDLRHGDVVFIRGHLLEHEVVVDGETDPRYCIVFTLGKNLKVDADSAGEAEEDESSSSDGDSSSSEG